MQLIISVQDSERSGMIASHDDVTSRKKSAVYTGALLDRLQVLNSDRPHEIHGMVDSALWPIHADELLRNMLVISGWET